MSEEELKQSKKRILITGGAGFVGHHCVDHLLKNTNWEIIVLDSLNYAANLNRITDSKLYDPKRVKFVWHDLKAPISSAIHTMLGNLDYCIHFAAESIPENVYIPIQSVPRIGTRMITFGELWKEQLRKNKPQKTNKGEIIYLKGDQTKALSFLNGGQWMPIKAITRHWYKGKIIKLKQKWGIVEATPNHSIYSANLELTNPETNPELLVVREINEIRKKYKKVDENLLTILAAYITEGNATFNKANGSYIVEIGQKDRNWLEDIGRSIKEAFCLNYNIIRGQGAFHLQVSNKDFFNYLIKNCGKYCDRKYFPNWIFDLRLEQREFFWQRLLEGDGTKDGRYSTTSYRLTNQISLLLALQKKKFRIFERNNGKYKRSWEFKTELSGQHYGLNKKEKIEIDYNGWVYDLEIEKTHNFVCGIGNVVCHNSHVDRSLQDSIPFAMSNVVGTAHLLEYIKEYQPNLKRYTGFNTDECFGPAPEGVYYKETDKFYPSNPYASSKCGQWAFEYSFAHAFKLPIVLVHSMNIVGERQHSEKFVPKTIKAILNREKIILHGRGRDDVASRCWIHARNVADGLLFLFERGEPKETYNIVGEEKTVLEIADWICEVIKGRKLKDDEIEFVEYPPERPGYDKRYALSGEKLAKMGWKPPVDLEDSLKKTVRWTLERQEWLNM